MNSDAFHALGQFLTATEAGRIAGSLEFGNAIGKALDEVHPERRVEVSELLVAADLRGDDPSQMIATLKAIAGAKSITTSIRPVWTMPGNAATSGRLTSEFHHIVRAARLSVTCATYNFNPGSTMWDALREASHRPGVQVTIYVDSQKGDPQEVKRKIPKATVYRSANLPNGKPIVSHAKFVIVDHEILLLTSANFSFSAENRNIELGLSIRDPILAESIEEMLESIAGTLYESSGPKSWSGRGLR